MGIFRSFVAAAFLLVPAATTASAANLVQNGDFEAGVTGWVCSVSSDSACRADDVVSGVGPGAGAESFFGYENRGTATLTQTVMTNIGDDYTFSFIAALTTVGGVGVNTLSYTLGGGAAAAVAGLVNGQYQSYSSQFTATGASTDIVFSWSTVGGSGGVRIDSVALTPSAVPLPAALPLLGAGLGGLAMVRRRARS